MTNKKNRTLVIIGGGEDKDGDCSILKEFVKLSGSAKARIVVMTVATDSPEELGGEYKDAFKSLGVDDIHIVDVSQRTDAYSENACEVIEKATGVFFTGGDQLHIPSLLGGTRMHDLICSKLEKGHVLAGTSAGAAMMSNSMIIAGKSNAPPKMGGIQIAPGLDFIPGSIIDTHFSHRGRIGRLLTAVAHYPQDIGFGIDENTALVVSGNEFTVIGENSVTVVDARSITYTNLPEIEENQVLSLYGTQVHILAAGCRFNIEEGSPICDRSVTEKGKARKARRNSKSTKSEK